MPLRAGCRISLSFPPAQSIKQYMCTPCVSEHWNEQLATLQIYRTAPVCPSQRVLARLAFPEHTIINCGFAFIEMLVTCDTVSEATVREHERVWKCSYRYLLAVYTKAHSLSLWTKALSLCVYPFPWQSLVLRSVSPRGAAALVVYEMASDTVEQGGAHFDAVCSRAATLVVTQDLAAAPCVAQMTNSSSLNDASISIPAELQQVIDAPHYQAMLQELADALCLEVQWERQIRLQPHYAPAVAAKQAVSKWIAQQNQLFDDLFSTLTLSAENESQVVFSKVAAQCYIEATKSQNTGEVKRAWNDAIEVIKLAELYVEKCEFATSILRLYARTVNAMAQNDEELCALWSKAASTARAALNYACKHATECVTFRCTFKQAELAARAEVAQRAGAARLASMWRDAAAKWEELEKCLRRTKLLKGRAYESAIRCNQSRRKEAEELEAAARAAQTMIYIDW